MKAFHGDEKLKDNLVKRMHAHKYADTLIQGEGWDGVKGCNIGCALEPYDHSKYPEVCGLPVWLAYLQDDIFENLEKSEAVEFASSVFPAIKIGVDLEKVQWRLAVLRHEKDLELIKDNDEDYAEECRQAIKQVIQYCHEKIKDNLSEIELESLRKKIAWAWVRAWAWASAEGRAEGRAETSAWASAWASAEAWAWASAWSSAEAWASAEGRLDHYRWEAATLIKLLSECEDKGE